MKVVQATYNHADLGEYEHNRTDMGTHGANLSKLVSYQYFIIYPTNLVYL